MKLSPEDFEKIKSFLSSDKRCMFVTGSAMYNKHKLVMAALDTLLRDSTILFRTNALLNIPVSGFLDWVGVSKIPASGQKYRIYNNYYQNIYGMYDDNWIDYDLDVAFTKLQLEKIIQKRYKLDHQEKMILQWLLEEDMEPKVCEAIRVILEMDV